MSALTLLAEKININRPTNRFTKKTAKDSAEASRLSEAVWFSISFLLFLIMGPFAAVPALFAVFSLASEVDVDEPAGV